MRSVTKIWLLTFFILLGTCGQRGYGQYLQYSLFQHAPYRINPALGAFYRAPSADLIYRDQKTGGGFNIRSSQFTYSQALGNGLRELPSLGLSVLDDRSGQLGYFVNQSVGLSLAQRVRLSHDQFLSVGLSGTYSTISLDAQSFTTGSQYVQYRGFSSSLPSGEAISQFRQNDWGISLGAMWVHQKPGGLAQSSVGLSFFDIRPTQISAENTGALSRRSIVAQGALALPVSAQWVVIPELIATYSAHSVQMALGPKVQFVPDRNARNSQYVSVFSRYITTGEIATGASIKKDRWTISAAYELSVNKTNTAHMGAFEVGLGYALPAKLKSEAKKEKEKPSSTSKKKKNKNDDWKEEYARQLAEKKAKQQVAKQKADSLAALKQVELAKADSVNEEERETVQADARSGAITQVVLLPDSVYHLRFMTDSHSIDEYNIDMLEGVLEMLSAFPEYHVELIGHTDNVGKSQYNQRLSEKRAETLKKILVLTGLPEERIVVLGRGDTQPLVPNDTEEGRRINRRVDIIIKSDW
ncbi:PorP/SprF family type IX secretion system membrane protein [Cytophagales bacterium LB-30]|uniref:PorP/SprF family type IX secretion system membrane protein n=1 Tax=Shiella aurantiaca TaxID=3058365 RepID=A0ABT8F6K5_9BACT|nr:PorP/SprF family type IX secretion system membrane protein [Shiella aurantiaca]MDN4165994.1 PorP/SprF family type IX secretion system membrane protein [Shiella aurantiaca]